MRQFGLHAANKQPYADNLLADLGAAHTTILLDGPEAAARVARIRAANPAMTILLRPYWPCDIRDASPVARANFAFEMVQPLLRYTNHVTLGNEFNVESGFGAGSPEQWRQIADYKLTLYRCFRELAPRVDLHLSAESWACGDDRAIQNPCGLELQRPTAELCDYVDAHAYWYPGKELLDEGGLRFLRVREIFPDTPMFLSEAGPLDLIDQPRAAAEIERWTAHLLRYNWLLGYALFMINWGPENNQLNYYNKPHILDRLKAMPKDTPLAQIPLGAFLPDMANWIVTRPFGFLDPQYSGGVHKGTDFAHPTPDRTLGARLQSPWPAVAPDVTSWRADRGWYGWWIRAPQPGDQIDILAHDSILEFFACHLAQEPVAVPSPLPGGTAGGLGHVGNTGALTTGPHLHAALAESEPTWPFAVRRYTDIMGPEVGRQWE